MCKIELSTRARNTNSRYKYCMPRNPYGRTATRTPTVHFSSGARCFCFRSTCKHRLRNRFRSFGRVVQLDRVRSESFTVVGHSANWWQRNFSVAAENFSFNFYIFNGQCCQVATPKIIFDCSLQPISIALRCSPFLSIRLLPSECMQCPDVFDTSAATNTRRSVPTQCDDGCGLISNTAHFTFKTLIFSRRMVGTPLLGTLPMLERSSPFNLPRRWRNIISYNTVNFILN